MQAGPPRAAGLRAHVRKNRERVDLRRAVVVDEDVGPERLRARLGERHEHRRARVGELPHGGDVRLGELPRVHQLVEERRDQVERGQALAGDERERAGRRPVGLAHEAAVDGRHARQRMDPHRVVEGHHAERALAPGVAALERVRQRAGVVILVGARDALRPAGGARRVEDQGEIALPGGRRARPAPALERLEGDRSRGGVGAHEDQREAPSTGGLQQGGRGRALEERERRARVLEHVPQLAGRQPEVDGRRHAPELLERPVDDDVLEPVLERDQDAVAPADGEPREAARDRGRARVEGRVREAPVAVHDGLGVGTAQRRAIEEPGERHETRRTFPLFFRSSTYWTAARAFESGKLRSITGFSVPCAT